MATEHKLDVGDYLLVGELVTGIPVAELRHSVKFGGLESALAAPFAGFGDEQKYEQFHERAAVLCSRLVRNHPLADGNKRCAWLAMTEFIERNGHTLPVDMYPDGAETIENLAAGTLSEDDFIEWVRERIDA